MEFFPLWKTIEWLGGPCSLACGIGPFDPICLKFRESLVARQDYISCSFGGIS